jgi:hypothetical protein
MANILIKDFYFLYNYYKMGTQTITKPECQTCGHKVSTSGVRLSSIEFRRKINSMKTIEELVECKNYLAQFVKSRFRLKECVAEFLKRLEDQFIINDSNIDAIKTWILDYKDNPDDCRESKRMLLGKDPESPLYDFLRLNYTEIDETFHEFYDNYAQNVDNPLNKNHVSRALNALGIKPVMKKIKSEDKTKCVMVINIKSTELSELLKKNGFYKH